MESPAIVYGRNTVLRWFRRAGFVNDSPDLVKPTEPLLLWRGTQSPRSTDGRGLSWTSDRENAEWFAVRPPSPWIQHSRPGWLWQATVAPRGVLGMFHDRGESEVVVSPRCIENLKLVANVLVPDRAKRIA